MDPFAKRNMQAVGVISSIEYYKAVADAESRKLVTKAINDSALRIERCPGKNIETTFA